MEWIYKIQYQSTCEVEMLKAMLVGKGYNQNEGLDYGEHSALLQLDCYDEVCCYDCF